MMVPLAKHFRKWLLALAVAAQNRLQAIVAGLTSAGKEKDAARKLEDSPAAPGNQRPGGPPDHWVQLVKRHAPELLLPGSPMVAGTRSPAALSEPATGRDESVSDDTASRQTRGKTSDGGDLDAGSDVDVKGRADPTPSIGVPPVIDGSKEEKPTPAIADRGPEPVHEPSVSTVATPAPSTQLRDIGASAGPPPPRAEDVRLSPVSELKSEKSPPRRQVHTAPQKRMVGAEAPAAGTREIESTQPLRTAARPPPLTAVPAIKTPAGPKTRRPARPQDDIKKSPARVQTGRRVEPVYPQEPTRRAGTPDATGQQAFKPQAEPRAHDERRDLDEPPKVSGSARDTEAWASAPQVVRAGDERGRIDGRPTAGPLPAAKKEEIVIAPATEFRWPGLPGETTYDDVWGPQRTAG